MSNSNSNIKTNTSTRTKMTLGLSAIATAMFASSAFAEPPVQPGDTLESLSKATVQTTVNGQPGSLEQMGIPKQVIAQAIAQNAVIDVQARTLRPMNAPVGGSMQASSQSPQATIQSMQSEQSAPVKSAANISTTNVEAPVNVETAAEVIARSNHLTLTHGLFYGALLVFAVFNLLLFFSSGTGYYFYNAFYLAALGLFLFAMGGFANQYFWPDNASFANTSIPLSLSLCALAMILFGRSFLEVERRTISETVLKGQAWFCIGFLLLTLILPYNKTILLNTVLAMTVISSLFIIAAVRWYLMAWLIMLVGGLIYALAAFGYLTDFLAREALMQSAVGGQVILLNYAMVQRWRLLNQKLLDVEHNARTELEFKVHERTAQLRNTMRELEKANRKLSTMSLNDALTGLHNRRHLNNIFPELCAEARRTSQPLTLALVDADHFKSINDTWGHGFGDTCLQFIAEMLTRHVKRPRDVAIRFGGEEFALLLPGTDAAGALNVCSALLQDIASTPLLSPDGTEVRMTLSAGIASLNPGETQNQLFERADEALYRAKSEGRNRAQLSDTIAAE